MRRLLAVARLGGILALCIDERVQDVDGIVFVGAHSPIENFLLARLGVEVPGAAGVLDQGNRNRPILGADIKRHRLVRLDHHAMHLVVAANEIRQHVLVGNLVASMENLVRVRTEDRCQRLAVIRLGRVVESQHCCAG